MNRILRVEKNKSGYKIITENGDPIQIWGAVAHSIDDPMLKEICKMKSIEIEDLVKELKKTKKKL